MPIEEMKREIKEYNKSQKLVLAENVIREAFQNNQNNLFPEGFTKCAFLLNELCDTKLKDKFITIGQRIYRYFQEGQWQEARNIITNVEDENWLGNANEELRNNLCDKVFKKILTIIYKITKRKEYVFTAKFCHWTAPKIFPIILKKA